MLSHCPRQLLPWFHEVLSHCKCCKRHTCGLSYRSSNNPKYSLFWAFWFTLKGAPLSKTKCWNCLHAQEASNNLNWKHGFYQVLLVSEEELDRFMVVFRLNRTSLFSEENICAFHEFAEHVRFGGGSRTRFSRIVRSITTSNNDNMPLDWSWLDFQFSHCPTVCYHNFSVPPDSGSTTNVSITWEL